jgi:hypothetical protein
VALSVSGIGSYFFTTHQIEACYWLPFFGTIENHNQFKSILNHADFPITSFRPFKRLVLDA